MNYLSVIKCFLIICTITENSPVLSSKLPPATSILNHVAKLNTDRNGKSVEEVRASTGRSQYSGASSGMFYKLNHRNEFDIADDILGKSLRIDSSDYEAAMLKGEEDEMVIVPSPYYEDTSCELDVMTGENITGEDSEDTEIEDEETIATDEDYNLDHNNIGHDFYTEFRSGLGEREYRQLSSGDNSNIPHHEHFYFHNVLNNQADFREKRNPGLHHTKLSPPLFLTPYAYSGNYRVAQNLSAVKPFVGDVRSYSGYLTVDQRYHSHLFFWFFQCERSDHLDRPVLLWLQGGPGASSLFGLFFENGPYKIKNAKIYRNEDTWTKQYNVLYIDNPVGTGFSFTTSNGYAKNQTIIGKHLYEALKQFFHLFPAYADNDFYITGESYAGKYIPAAAYEIHKQNLLSHFKIPLKGLFIGNGLIDPISMLEYSDYLYHIGLLDETQRKMFSRIEDRIKQLIRTRRWRKATNMFEDLFFSSHENKTTGPNFRRITGFRQHYNLNGLDFNTREFNSFLQDEVIRERLHVGDMKFNKGEEVGKALEQDIMKSILDKVNILIENYRIVFYYGQLDIICPYRLSEAFFSNIEFRYAYDYYKAERKVWTYERQDDQDNIVGFIKEAHNLVEVLIRNAGHMVPRDQPRFMMDLLRKYIGS